MHLDSDWVESNRFLESLQPAPDIDVCVVAGDWLSAASAAGTQRLYDRLLECYDQVLVVPGNHQYWGESIVKAEHAMMSTTPRIHVCLEPQYVTLKGQTFFAGTLWYRRPAKNQAQLFIDMQVIRCPKGWFFYQQRLFQEGLRERKDLSDVIVVSHHLPSSKSTPAQYGYSLMNHFFVCNMTKDIEELKPKLWLHGHTHDPCDYDLGQTRVVCNPRGYPWEYRNRRPYEPLLIEV
jgi:Icc-related predicted phosphoesterase